jgi:mono/diheme cytochrome c family protein
MFDRLHLGLGWIGATLIPAIGLIVLAALPWIESRLPKFFARYVLGCLCLLYGVAALGFGGSFAPLTGTRDPVVTVEPKVRQAAPINASLATQGKALFATSGCADCHGSDGLKGGAGPSLKNIWKTNPDPEFYERYIHAPTSVDPQSTMPPFGNLNNQELAAIAEFLRAPR